MKLAEHDVRGSARSRERNRHRLARRAATVGSLLWIVAAVRVEAQAPPPATPYAPLGVDLLLQGRPQEGLVILHSGYRNSPYIDADAVVFLGASQFGREGDV